MMQDSDFSDFDLGQPLPEIHSLQRPQLDITPLALKKLQELKVLYAFKQQAPAIINTPVGMYSDQVFSETAFHKQYHQFLQKGYATDPNDRTKSIIIDKDRHPSLYNRAQQGQRLTQEDPELVKQLMEMQRGSGYQRKLKAERVGKDPWSGYKGQLMKSQPISEQQERLLKQFQERRQQKVQQLRTMPPKQFDYKTQFFRTSDQDYKGRKYIQPPNDYQIRKSKCFIPKGCSKVWQCASRSGFMCAKFFPKFGHYVLAGNIQGQIKLFDVARDRQLTRSYTGHSAGVRDVQFSKDGSFFISCSYDGTVLHWDTETGKVSKCFRMKSIPYCVKLNYQFQKHNSFLAGLSSKHIHQIDMRTSKVELSYDQHLSSVNTLTFVDYRRFVSTSDDKKVFLWEFGVPVVIRHISQPQMHAITYTSMHPEGKYFAGQSSDNRVVIYEWKDGTFRSNKKKNFYGHMNTGYTCGVSFSNDGKLVVSGDQKGRLFFYDFKTCKNFRVLESHREATVAVEWHPWESNTVLTCGWEGTVKLWQ